MIEIERKFLVNSDAFKKEAFAKRIIKQGYLSSVPERTVLSRFEWEKEIQVHEAEQLLLLCEKGIINKTRFEIKAGPHTYEVDEFHDDNEGLVVAEIELATEDEDFIKPFWLGDEVTTDKRYYNSYLSLFPYKEWE